MRPRPVELVRRRLQFVSVHVPQRHVRAGVEEPFHVARPIPCAPPVTTARRLVRSIRFIGSSVCSVAGRAMKDEDNEFQHGATKATEFTEQTAVAFSLSPLPPILEPRLIHATLGTACPRLPSRKSKSAPRVRLHHVTDVELRIAARDAWRSGSRHSARRRASSSSGTSSRRTRCSTSSSIMSPSRTSASGPPTAASGHDVQHHRSVRGAAHACVRDAHHVGHAALQELWRQPHVADLRHAGIALRPAVLQHEHAVLVHVQFGIARCASCSARWSRRRPRGRDDASDEATPPTV